MDNYEAYIASFVKEKDPFIVEMEQYAEEHHVPIMDSERHRNYLLVCYEFKIRSVSLKSVVRSAIRLSGLLRHYLEASIVTIERDTERYLKAVEYIERSGFERTNYNY